MKKKLLYIFMLVLAIIGCRIIYGINYGLDNKLMIMDNLYRYDIFDNADFLDILMDGKYFYYVTRNISNYSFIKYDYTKNKILKEYNFSNKDNLTSMKIVKNNNNFYLTSPLSNKIYFFNNNLDLLKIIESNNSNKIYGLYNKDIFEVSNNKIIYHNNIYDELPNTCGNIEEILYYDNTYLRFYNRDKSLGCLYNMRNKNIYYLDSDGVILSHDNYLEYHTDSLKFRFNNQDYYFSDITENSNLTLSEDNEYFLTFNSTNKKIRIYNLETRKIIREKELPLSSNSYVSNIKIGNYAYFTVFENNKNYLYIWDYSKENRVNYNMLSNDEKEYKFKNDRLLEELNNKYHVNVYIYDEAVKYFDEIYVIPSYDNILINTKLNEINNVLINYNINKNTNIYLEKNIILNKTNQKILSKTIIDDESNNLIISITDDNFKENLINELNKII